MDTQQKHTMVVAGVGAAELTPDMAQIEVSLEVTHTNPSEAYTEVNSVVRRVVAVLDEQGIAEADRQTRAMSLTPTYAHDGPTATIIGYTATHALRLRIVRLSMISEILDALVEVAGEALRLGGLALGGSDTGEARARAEAVAVADARQRAQRLAEAAGVALGSVLAIREESQGTQQAAVGLGWRAESAVHVQAGADTVHARVIVTFALQE